MEFGKEGKARQLVATGNLLTEREVSGKPTQTATAQSGVAQLLGKTERRRPERASGPRDVCAGNADGSADGKSAGARRSHGDTGAADHLCANHWRDSCRRGRSVDGFFDKRERSATGGGAGEHFRGHDAGKLEDGQSFVYRTCAFVAGRFGYGSRLDRAAARGAGHERQWKCSRRVSPSRGAIDAANRCRASRAEEGEIVACNGRHVDVSRLRQPRTPGKKCAGAIGGAKDARRRQLAREA